MTEGTHHAFQTSWGTNPLDGGTRFRLWAPGTGQIELAIEPAGGERRFIAMKRDDAGWWQVDTDQVSVGGAYGFRVDGGLVVPDPAARAQMTDVHGLSRLVDPKSYLWRTPDWKGRPWQETVFYELHTGTFTPQGTFDAVIDKLDHLRDLGITAIELLPVGAVRRQPWLGLRTACCCIARTRLTAAWTG